MQQPARFNGELDSLDTDSARARPCRRTAGTQQTRRWKIPSDSSHGCKASSSIRCVRAPASAAASGEGPQIRAVRAIQEALTLVGDTDDSEAIGPIDWVKFGERLQKADGPQQD